MNPQAFGKYQLLKKLATGGMAEVWLARQTGIEGFQKDVVVKRILPHLAEDREFVEMFKNEAMIAARFNHPNIAQVYEFGEANGTYYIAMEFIHGEDLGRVMRKASGMNQWIARPLAIRIVASACEGLYYAHSRADDAGRPLNVVHRDISPQNILISFDGSVKLVDFGIAKAADQASMTKSGAIKGKFAYMAPRAGRGQAPGPARGHLRHRPGAVRDAHRAPAAQEGLGAGDAAGRHGVLHPVPVRGGRRAPGHGPRGDARAREERG